MWMSSARHSGWGSPEYPSAAAPPRRDRMASGFDPLRSGRCKETQKNRRHAGPRTACFEDSTRSRPDREAASSQPGAIDAGLVQQFGHARPRVEHAGLHGVERDAGAPRHRFDGLVLVVEELHDLALRRRQLRQALLENLAP